MRPWCINARLWGGITVLRKTKKAPVGRFFLNLVGRAGFEPATN